MSNETNNSKQIELNLEDVTGPVLYTRPLDKQIGPLYINDIIRFFIPINLFNSNELRSNNLFGSSVYPISSSLPAICAHLGIILKAGSKNDDKYYVSRVMTVFDQEFNVTQFERFEVVDLPGKIHGIDLICQITDIRSSWVGSKQFEVKTKSSISLASHGIAVIFGQPAFSEMETFDQDLLPILKQQPEDSFYEGRNWLRFSLTGEPGESYDIRNFSDEGQPFSSWLSQKFKQFSLYFDTKAERYEMAMIASGDNVYMNLSRLNEPVPCVPIIKNNGAPVKQDKKTPVMEMIEWDDIVWDNEGVWVLNSFYGPILSCSWVKRRRQLR